MIQNRNDLSIRKKKVLFIGNGINNLNNEKSWDNLVAELRKRVGKKNDAKDLIKQFPMVFENLLNYGILNRRITNENDLKNIVAEKVTEIQPNQIHDRITRINPEHIITTNYDFVLEKGFTISKISLIDEKRFSVFRKFSADGRYFWHVHGDCSNPKTINLGFEHYSGQLQYLRNYVVSGTQYKSNKVPKEPLSKRLKSLAENPIYNDTIYSWVDLMFTEEVHIIGLCLDFIEIDLWWLLTYRAKLKGQKGMKINNKIYYYIPTEFCEQSEGKIEVLNNVGIEVIKINKSKYEFYNSVFDKIEGM